MYLQSRTRLFVTITVICWNICRTLPDQTVCSEYLVSGLYGVEDSALTASSIWPLNTTVCGPQNARLHFDGKYATTRVASSWCAGTIDNQQYIQVQFPRETVVDTVLLQGRGDHVYNQWVETYYLMYSIDGITWTNVTSQRQQPTLFTGNNDTNTVVKSNIDPSIIAVYLRIHPRNFSNHISLRFDVSGCYKVEKTSSCSELYRLSMLTSPALEQHLLFERQSNSLQECGKQCHKDKSCLSVSFEMNRRLCRGFGAASRTIYTALSAEQTAFFVNKGIFTSLGYRQILNGIRYYKVNELNMNQTSAADVCVQQNSQLIRIDSQSEMSSLQTIITGNTILMHDHNHMFVSGKYVSNQWQYSDGEEIDSALWSPGNPDPNQGHCVMLTQTGLASVHCTESLFSICGLF